MASRTFNMQGVWQNPKANESRGCSSTSNTKRNDHPKNIPSKRTKISRQVPEFPHQESFRAEFTRKTVASTHKNPYTCGSANRTSSNKQSISNVAPKSFVCNESSNGLSSVPNKQWGSTDIGDTAAIPKNSLTVCAVSNKQSVGTCMAAPARNRVDGNGGLTHGAGTSGVSVPKSQLTEHVTNLAVTSFGGFCLHCNEPVCLSKDNLRLHTKSKLRQPHPLFGHGK